MLCQRRRIHLIYRETADLVRIIVAEPRLFWLTPAQGFFLNPSAVFGSRLSVKLGVGPRSKSRYELPISIRIQIWIRQINSNPDGIRTTALFDF